MTLAAERKTAADLRGLAKAAADPVDTRKVCQREAAAEARRAATHTFRSVSGLNADLKQAVTCQETARSKAKLKRTVVGHMRKLSKMPERVRSFFGSKTFRYAA